MTVNLAPGLNLERPRTPTVLALKEVFQGLDADSCPGSYNFHLHTVCSDGQLRPDELMESAIAIGLKGLAITDHHSTNGYFQAQIWLDRWILNNSESKLKTPTLWAGIEISANLLNIDVHILGYGFEPGHSSLQPYLHGKTAIGDAYLAENVIDAIHQSGGLAVLAHPCRYRLSPNKLIPEAASFGIDGVETFYAYGNPIPWCPSPQQTMLVKELAKDWGLFNTCGTDTHGVNLLQKL
ncbi:PHP domain-containing protein [Phormidium nigroviride]